MAFPRFPLQRLTARVALGAFLCLTPLAVSAATLAPPSTPVTPPEIVKAAETFATDQLGGALSYCTVTKWATSTEEAYICGVGEKASPGVHTTQGPVLPEGLRPLITILCKTVGTGTNAISECASVR